MHDFHADTYPEQWKNSVTIMLRKLAKMDYTVPSTHCPVALINSLCSIGFIPHGQDPQGPPREPFQMLPSLGKMTDSLHYMMKVIKAPWKGGKVVSTLFLYIKSTFPSVVLSGFIPFKVISFKLSLSHLVSSIGVLFLVQSSAQGCLTIPNAVGAPQLDL